MSEVRNLSRARRDTISPLGLSGSRNDHAQLFARDGKGGGQMAGPLAIQLKGRGGVARQFKGGYAEPLPGVDRQFSPGEQTGRATQQRQPVCPWQNAKVQKSVAQICPGE